MILEKLLPKHKSDIRETETMLLFWGSFLSNFYMEDGLEMYHKGTYFPSSEHIFMSIKAEAFDDKEIMKELTKVSTPMEAKKLGRKVKGFDEEIWRIRRKEAMLVALWAKFSQNKELMDALLATEDKMLVEASPYDKIWGIGLHSTDDRALDPNNWLGVNLLGTCLMEIREHLKVEWHEYLNKESYYENNPVSAGRSNKTCEHCNKTIPKGMPHDVHKFYPEFTSYPTHKKCTPTFLKSIDKPSWLEIIV